MRSLTRIKLFTLLGLMVGIVSQPAMALSLDEVTNNVANTTTVAVGGLTSKIKNDVACLKGVMALQGLKRLNTKNTTRATKLQNTEDTLQLLCAQYTQFSFTTEAAAREKLAADIQKSCDTLDRNLNEFTYNSSEAQIEYSADNYGELATVSVALNRFTASLIKAQASARDAAEETVLRAVIQSTTSAATHAKRLLSTAPGGLEASNRPATKNLSANTVKTAPRS